jgi:alcohol sulfotransferase
MIYDLPSRLWRKLTHRTRLAAVAASADAFLASYPKSGRTWLRFILSTYFARTAGFETPIDLHNMFRILPNFDFDPVRGVPAFEFAGSGAARAVPFVPVSHHGYQTSRFRARPIIFMIRDPRDVMVSAYFHATRHKHRFEGDISSFLRDDGQGLPALTRYLNGWAAGLARHERHIVSYERLTADTEGGVRDIVQFLGRDVNEAELARAVDASRFEAMRAREQKQGLPAHEYDRDDTESLRMRRGKVGGFGDYLSDADSRFIETSSATLLSPPARELVAMTGMPLG